jgi:ABC-type transport system involved in multi-copper enzyme maturation permease subunit
MNRVATIAFHTFKEAVRDKVLYNLIVFALLMIGSAILFSTISVGIQPIIVVDLGLSSISVFGLMMAIFIGIGLVSKEIERRTIYQVLSKPVRRFEFIIGKYLGLILTLLVNTSIMTAGFYLALIYQKRGLSLDDVGPVATIYFILLQLAMVVGLAVFFSTISTPILSAVFTLSVYVIGHLLSEMRWLGQISGSGVVHGVTSALYYLLPNFSNFDFITQTAHGERISGVLLVSNSLYALLYVTVLISASILIFEDRDLK